MNGKKLLAGALLLLLVLWLALINGWFEDALKQDLEAYVNFEFAQGKKAQALMTESGDRSITSAQSREELLEILRQRRETMLQKLDNQKSYQPRTRELREIHAKGIALLELRAQLCDQFVWMASTPETQWAPEEKLHQQQLEINRLGKEYQRELRSLMNDKKVRLKVE